MLRIIEELIYQYVPHAHVFKPVNHVFGHITTNATILEPEKTTDLINALLRLPEVDKCEHKNFLNIFLRPEFFGKINWSEYKIENILTNIEYCSPNPTGPLHLGHARSTFWGESLVKIFKFLGCDTKSEIYINDCGNQIQQLKSSILYHKNLGGELTYLGSYVKEMALGLPNNFTQEDMLNLSLKNIFRTLKKYNIQHEILSYESIESKKYMNDVLNLLQHHIKRGFIPNQKSDGELLYITLGDEYFVLQKSDGQYTYFANDIAYAYGKYIRGFKRQILLLGEDHIGHIFKLIEVMKLINISLEVVSLAMITATRDNHKVLMSKRSGNFIGLEYLFDKYGKNDILSLVFQKNSGKTITLEDEKLPEYPDFLFQYVLQRTANFHFTKIEGLNTEQENLIFTRIVFASRTVYEAANGLNPHILFDVAYKLAVDMHHIISNHTLLELQSSSSILNLGRQVLRTYLELLNYAL